MKKRAYVVWMLCLIGGFALLTSCTAQQWQTTKEAMVLTALVGLAGAVASDPYYVPPLTTHCESACTAYGCHSRCTTY